MKNAPILIKERAFNIFMERSPNTGCHLDDWLKAEKEVAKELWGPNQKGYLFTKTINGPLAPDSK